MTNRKIKYYAAFVPNEPYNNSEQYEKYVTNLVFMLHEEGIAETGAIGEYFDASFINTEQEFSKAQIDYELYEISGITKLVNILKSVGAPKGSELSFTHESSEIVELIKFD